MGAFQFSRPGMYFTNASCLGSTRIIFLRKNGNTPKNDYFLLTDKVFYGGCFGVEQVSTEGNHLLQLECSLKMAVLDLQLTATTDSYFINHAGLASMLRLVEKLPHEPTPSLCLNQVLCWKLNLRNVQLSNPNIFSVVCSKGNRVDLIPENIMHFTLCFSPHRIWYKVLHIRVNQYPLVRHWKKTKLFFPHS